MKSSLFIILLVGFFSFNPKIYSDDETISNVEVMIGPGFYYDDDYYDEDVVWIGPGWYFGVWFDYDIDFYEWRSHHHGYHGRGHHGGHHGGHHHGGGGHHGGHHGGRHH
jgi:hypothetical protein